MGRSAKTYGSIAWRSSLIRSNMWSFCRLLISLLREENWRRMNSAIIGFKRRYTKSCIKIALKANYPLAQKQHRQRWGNTNLQLLRV